MNTGSRRILPLVVGALVMVLVIGTGTGCATRGYVRTQVAEARADLGQQVAQVQGDLAATRNSVEQATVRADQAMSSAGQARDLALGKLGYKEFTQSSVNFAHNSTNIDDQAQAVLNDLATQILNRPELLVDIYGFTDGTGSDDYNFGLGLRRAEAVERYLAERTPGQLTRYAAISYGESKPVADESTRAGRTQNRRVLISLIERVPLSESGSGGLSAN